MKRVYCSDSLADIHYLKGLLERTGVPCIVKNEQLIGGLGDIPFLECIPELWVLNDEHLELALELIEEHRSRPASTKPWRCLHCRETNEGQFALCWKCGEPDERDV